MLYLASQSPRRRQLLHQLGRPFRVVRSRHRETIRRGASPSANAMRNATGKAMHARLPSRAHGIVIGADTFLYVRGRVIGKPRSLRQAAAILQALSGSSHWVYTGLCLRAVPACPGSSNRRAGAWRCRTGYAKTKVTFKRLTPETIARVLAHTPPLDKAGGYAIQRDGGTLIARIEGSRSNVIGLPLELLRRELAVIDTRQQTRIDDC